MLWVSLLALALSAAVLITFLVMRKGQEGPAGPVGPAGPEGPEGPDGDMPSASSYSGVISWNSVDSAFGTTPSVASGYNAVVSNGICTFTFDRLPRAQATATKWVLAEAGSIPAALRPRATHEQMITVSEDDANLADSVLLGMISVGANGSIVIGIAKPTAETWLYQAYFTDNNYISIPSMTLTWRI